MVPETIITYSQMSSFLKSRSFPDLQSAMQDAKSCFSGQGRVSAYSCPFHKDLDVITMPDGDFLQLCDELPVLLSTQAYSDPLHFRSLAPPGYDCFITMHLNSLPSTEYDHDFFEICYVWDGSCRQQVQGQSVLMRKGDFLIIPPGFRHRIILDDTDSVIFYIIVLPGAFKNSYGSFLSQQNVLSAFLRTCLLNDSPRTCLLIHTGPQDLFLKRILKHFILECYVEQTIFCDFATGILNQLFSYMILYGEVESDLLGLPNNLAFLSLLRDIQKNYQTVTLHGLAEKYHFAEESLSRMIRRMTGKTFTALVRGIRIEHACFLLSNTDYSLEQICGFIGYKEYSSFYRVFLKETSMSPGAYRKKNPSVTKKN